MKFKSRKDGLFSLMVFGINIFLLGMMVKWILDEDLQRAEYGVLVLVMAVVALLFWVYYGTAYELSQEQKLRYNSGPFRGSIEISGIREIVQGQTLWVGFRPATARRGLIIKYNKYDEIYISPESNQAFIESILKLNDQISIKG